MKEIGIKNIIVHMVDDVSCQKIDLSKLRYIAVGGSPITDEQEIKINEFLKNHGCKVNIRKGSVTNEKEKNNEKI